MNTASTSSAGARFAAVLANEALSLRAERKPDLRTESAALCNLSKALADDPRLALRQLLDTAVRLCKADSAGLSLLWCDEAGEIVQWAAISGALSSQEGRIIPRALSTCSLCLDAGAPILLSQADRGFSLLRDVQPAILEELSVPLYDHLGKPLGAVWAAHHDPAWLFCADDARVMEQLGAQASLALELIERAKDHRYALALMHSHQAAQRDLLDHSLHHERTLCEEAETCAKAVEQALAFKDALIHESHHRAKNTLQIAASLLSVHARAASSAQVSSALAESRDRLRALARVHELLSASEGGLQTVLMSSLLQGVGAALTQSFGEMSERVKLTLDVEQLELTPEDAIPLALLVNEVVTNAYKHAFPGRASGAITVELRRSASHSIVLRITDDGIGMPSSDGNNGFGLGLIHTLAAQLRGALTIASDANRRGTTIKVTMRPDARRGDSTAELTRELR